jgi:high-affinity K+ transport system ATPase subunit B
MWCLSVTLYRKFAQATLRAPICYVMRVSQLMTTSVLCPCLTEPSQFAKFVPITAVFWDVTVYFGGLPSTFQDRRLKQQVTPKL